jgi:hypothetical protein
MPSDELAAAWQIGSGDVPHQLIDAGVGLLDQVPQCLNDFHKVVGRAVGRHADRDTRCPIDQQVRKCCWEDGRLDILAVVIRLEVDGVLVKTVGHGCCGRCHSALGVAHGSGAVVQRAEIAMTIDQRQPHGPRLSHPDQRVIDGGIAMGMVLTHDLTDYPSAFDMRTVWADAHLIHGVQDPALYRLQPVSGVGKGSGIDN